MVLMLEFVGFDLQGVAFFLGLLSKSRLLDDLVGVHKFR